MTLKKGDKAPLFSLPNPEGKTISLGNLLENNQYVLLVFLRHLG
jgi:peroxiredoxin